MRNPSGPGVPRCRPSVLEAVQLCPDWATFFWAPAAEVVGPDVARRPSATGQPDVRQSL